MNHDRGQLILVGAVAIALVLLGLVLVVNTALFTQIVGSEGTVDATQDGGISSHEIGNALAAVVAAENREEAGADDVDDAFEIGDEGDVVESAMVNRTLEHSGAIVSVEYSGHNDTGTRIAQEDVNDFTNASSNDPWKPINDSESGELGRFAVTINTSSSATGDLSINVKGSNDLVLGVDESDGSVTVDTDSSTGDCEDIEATNGTVRVDVYNGYVAERADCQFDLLDSKSAPQWIEFGGDIKVVEGTYEIVTDADVPVTSSRFAPDSEEPTATEAVWSFDYEYSFRTNAATVESDQREVEVYD